MSGFRISSLPLLFGLAANAAAQAFLLVVLPGLGRDLGFSAMETGLLLGLGALVLLIAAPVSGGISETRGRRFVLLSGLFGAALGTSLMAVIIGLRLAGDLERETALIALFGARALQSLLTGGLLPAAQAWMADRTTADQRAEGMGLLGASYGIGAIVGAASAFKAGGSAPVEALVALAVAVAVGFVLVLLLIRNVRTEPLSPIVRIGFPLRLIWSNLIVTFLGICVYGVMQHVTALRLEDGFGLPRADAISTAGAGLMTASIAMAAMQIFGLRIIKLRPALLLLLGAMAGALAMLAATLAVDVPMLLIALGVLGAGLGLLLPSNLALLSFIAGPAAQGRVAGVNAIAQGLGLAAGPIAGAALHKLALSAPSFAATVALAVVASIAVVTVFRRGQAA
ncbi:MFS transporter [Hyphomicrobium sulfonivorans]|uniref:MFS transporter n=1 Tax=Hyphomicrobium sulfonivorans TaxID=121290 RepID=UPI00156FCB72|nr:MFS transporter [Hyphomicrobium sulfonivorans]MBI1651369.1 MFS transporter [Hyphomicrobium sulfonivorans]NSL73308.1 MFS transporter [Hyphomicrobium sulfonivorans]